MADATKDVITFNSATQTPNKLTSTNFYVWKMQIESLLIGYDLIGYVTGTITAPAATIPATATEQEKPNPAYTLWHRQDQLLVHLLISSISPEVATLLYGCTTAASVWSTITATYATPSRGRVKQIKAALKALKRGTLPLTEFLYAMKSKSDELSLLGSPMDKEDFIDIILDNLGDEYNELIRAIQARDTVISFEELHEKLLNFKVLLAPRQPSFSPVTAHPAYRPATPHQQQHYHQQPPRYQPSPHHNWRGNNGPSQPSYFGPNSQQQYGFNGQQTCQSSINLNRPRRPYLGKCQLCQVQGHSAPYCSQFQQFQAQAISSQEAPQANIAAPHVSSARFDSSTPNWPVNGGASSHAATDLQNLSLHSPYPAPDDKMLGDGTSGSLTPPPWFA